MSTPVLTVLGLSNMIFDHVERVFDESLRCGDETDPILLGKLTALSVLSESVCPVSHRLSEEEIHVHDRAAMALDHAWNHLRDRIDHAANATPADFVFERGTAS